MTGHLSLLRQAQHAARANDTAAALAHLERAQVFGGLAEEAAAALEDHDVLAALPILRELVEAEEQALAAEFMQ